MTRSRLILFTVTLLAAAAMLVWEVFWIEPEKDCLKHGGDWAGRFRACGHVVSIEPGPSR